MSLLSSKLIKISMLLAFLLFHFGACSKEKEFVDAVKQNFGPNQTHNTKDSPPNEPVEAKINAPYQQTLLELRKYDTCTQINDEVRGKLLEMKSDRQLYQLFRRYRSY